QIRDHGRTRTQFRQGDRSHFMKSTLTIAGQNRQLLAGRIADRKVKPSIPVEIGHRYRQWSPTLERRRARREAAFPISQKDTYTSVLCIRYNQIGVAVLIYIRDGARVAGDWNNNGIDESTSSIALQNGDALQVIRVDKKVRPTVRIHVADCQRIDRRQVDGLRKSA